MSARLENDMKASIEQLINIATIWDCPPRTVRTSDRSPSDHMGHHPTSGNCVTECRIHIVVTKRNHIL